MDIASSSSRCCCCCCFYWYGFINQLVQPKKKTKKPTTAGLQHLTHTHKHSASICVNVFMRHKQVSSSGSNNNRRSYLTARREPRPETHTR